MAKMTPKQLITAILIIAGIAAAGLVLWSLSGFSSVEVTITLVCLLLGFAQLSSHINRQNERAQADREIEDLGRATTNLARELQSTKSTIEQLETELDKAVKQHSNKVTSQMRVLETLVRQMSENMTRLRDREASAATTAGGQSSPMPAGKPEQDAALLETVRQAIARNRIELFVQPIVTLPQRKTRFYEEVTYLRSEEGDLIAPDDYREIAAANDLMPSINNPTMLQSVQLLQNLKQRNEETVLVCNLSLSAINDPAFFAQFIEYMNANQELSEAIIFEFAQQEIDTAGALELEGLAAIAALGFRFSIDNVHNLDLDFHELSERNFQFLKLDADVLLNRIEEVNSPIQSEDLCALLGRYGIELIINNIPNERVVANVLDYDVTMGQGSLFSEPRPVKGNVLDEELMPKSAAS